jgi:phosphate-selective porin OprO/OprP
VSSAEGFDTLNILDVFLNVHYDDRLQFKIGRYKTPFTYEFYSLPINGLISPERSLFFNNFGVNRDLGIMAWGNLFENHFEYAWGVFNGTRNGFLDANDYKDTMGLVSFRPFIKNEGSRFQNLTIGGSYDYGIQDSQAIPRVFRTNVATTGNLTVGVEFLALNNNVKEFGDRSFWTMHVAHYFRHLSFIAEWQSGFQDYAIIAANPTRVNVPVQSFYLQAGYFITGETVTGRGILKPIHPFDIRKGKVGLGAIELTGRYDYMNIGSEVFTRGLADGNLWTNRIQTIDLGVNWYWSQAIKVYLGWQLALFGDPVTYEPGRFENQSNQLWVRWQLFF